MLKTISICLVLVTLGSTALVGKIEPDLLKSLKTKNLVNIFVTLNERTTSVLDEIANQKFLSRGDKVTGVYKALNAHAAKSQKNILELLKSPRYFATQVQSFWITNQVYVKGADQSLIKLLATMEEVESISEEEIIHLDDPQESDVAHSPRNPGVLAEWGIDKIQAPAAWAWAGNDGAGAVIGVIDSGARATHEALRGSYRGGDYSWFDAVGGSLVPRDGNGHGTHCTGTVAGSHGIGVAPGAKWIACKGLDDAGSGASNNLIRCAEFMTCPFKPNGQDPDCSQAPHVVSNSWGGAGGRTVYDAIIAAWHVAEVIPVTSLGNNGPSCSSSGHPGDSRSGVLGIGSTNINDGISSFSSRGPSVWGQQKPEVSAPGDNVRSASHTSDTLYTAKSGTSMACPHVAGLVGLIKARNPRANYTTIVNILQSTADRNLLSTGQTCDGVTDREYPNYTFGYGRINALRAVQATSLSD